MLSPAHLQAAPRLVRTARTVLKVPHPDQVPVRQAWALANHAQLEFVAWWRKSADIDAATRSAASELASVERGDELIFNVFEVHADTDVLAHYACGPFLGRIDLHSWDFGVPRCELGYMADVRTTTPGLFQEAVGAALALAFAMGTQRIEAITDTRNLRSIRFAQRLGLTVEGIMRNHERDHNGQLCDQTLLALTAP